MLGPFLSLLHVLTEHMIRHLNSHCKNNTIIFSKCSDLVLTKSVMLLVVEKLNAIIAHPTK